MYNEIASNKRRTWVLVSVFCAIVMALIVIFGYEAGIDPIMSLAIGLIFSVFYALISFYLSDRVVILTQGAKPITKEQGKEIYLLVENLTIASGMPMPELYIIDDPSPNAFATGRDPQHAKIVFTTGILRILDKTELEGVIAHELSHIKNYDIRLMTIIVVLVGLVVLLSDIFLRLSFKGNNNRQTPWPFILAAIILGILSPFIAQIIKLAVSRTREYLADASGALITRHPDALARALQKISSVSQPLKRANHATAHLFITNPFGTAGKQSSGWYSRLFSTHPPVAERIAKLQSMGR